MFKQCLQTKLYLNTDFKKERERTSIVSEVCAWQRDGPLQRTWGRCLFDMWRLKQGSLWGRGMSKRRSDERQCQRIWGTRWPPSYSYNLSVQRIPPVHVLFLTFYLFHYKGVLWIKDDPLLSTICWLNSGLCTFCHPNIRVQASLFGELLLLQKAQAYTHHSILGGVTTKHFSPRNTPLQLKKVRSDHHSHKEC